MAIADALLVVGADLGGGYDIGLSLDCSGFEKCFPVCLAGPDCECRGIGNDLSILSLQRETNFWEAKLSALLAFYTTTKTSAN